MPSQSDLRAARAELQKMQADMADDKAFGLFSPALQRRITDMRKSIADLTVEFGKQRDAEKRLHDVQAKRAADEAKANRTRLAAAGAILVAYRRVTGAVTSLTRAGMENTIEATRQQIAYQLLGREVAGVFMPATTASTNAMIAGAKAMTGMNEKGQNLVFVLSYAVSGLVAFKTAQLAANAAGLKFSGVAGGIVTHLGKIGLIGGAIAGLGALFLATDAGARALEDTMKNLVTLANALAENLDEAMNNPGKFWDDFKIGLAQIGEWAGAAPEGRARAEFDDAVINAKKRNGLDEQRAKDKDKNNRRRPTENNFRFEGVSDAFERVQIAAAKQSLVGPDIPKEQLKVQEQIRDEIKKLDGMPARVLDRVFKVE